MTAKPLILFFNKFFDTWPDVEGLICRSECEFTTDRERMSEAHAVVFHLPRLEGFSGLIKPPNQLWVAWSMESPQSCTMMRDSDAMSRFDLRMTYERDADIWVPYLADFDDASLLRPPPRKTESSPVVRFQSNPFDHSGRNRLAALLMTRIKVDSYGTMNNNRTLDVPDRGPETMRKTLSRYKFALAFENAIEPDYVSDKIYDALVAGTVPVYFGAQNIDEFAPGDNCFINAADFDGANELGAYLNYLDKNDEAYQAYFAWKTKGLLPSYLTLRQKVDENCFCRLCGTVTARVTDA